MQYRQGGRRRIDRVLDPAVLEGLPQASAEDLRSLADDAGAEEAELSYVRRLLQGRLDQVRGEVERRRSSPGATPGPRSDEELVSMLTSVLSEERTVGTGAQRYVDVEVETGGDRRRTAELAAADVRVSDPAALSDDGLATAGRRLTDLEAAVSQTRRDLQAVVDAVAVELATRAAAG